ncbi:hypothetical protein DRN97_12000, partial [Methanosarcinales archaeon]
MKTKLSIGERSCLLVILILISAITIASTSAIAASPTAENMQNTEGVASISRTEVIDAVMAYMKAIYLGEDVEYPGKEELRKVAC